MDVLPDIKNQLKCNMYSSGLKYTYNKEDNNADYYFLINILYVPGMFSS